MSDHETWTNEFFNLSPPAVGDLLITDWGETILFLECKEIIPWYSPTSVRREWHIQTFYEDGSPAENCHEWIVDV